MKNIENKKSSYSELFSQQYYQKSFSELNEDESRICSMMGEFWGYASSVIPDGFEKYSIFDFIGFTVDKNNNVTKSSLPKEVVKFAKNKICEFCWGITWDEIRSKAGKTQEEKNKFLRNKNIMDQRLKNGNNIVIFGGSPKPTGKTLLASIVMKEAIRLRVIKNCRKHTYDWVDFTTLVDSSIKDSFDVSDYRTCDWLVVDNIISFFRSAKQTTLVIDSIDSFFIDRLNNNLPTILVFKFDINTIVGTIEQQFGVGINRLIESKKTYIIPLS